MVKLAVALCILLVAGTVQGESILDSITSALAGLIERIHEERAKLEAVFDNAINNAAGFKKEMDNTVNEAIAQWNEKLAGISGDAEAVSSCASSSINFEAKAEDVKSNADDCIQGRLNTMTTDFELTKTAFYDFLDELNEIRTKTEKCLELGEYLDIYYCLVKIGGNTSTEIRESWAALLNKATTLTADFVAFENALSTCGFTDGMKTLQNEADAAYEGIKKCVDNKDSATV